MDRDTQVQLAPVKPIISVRSIGRGLRPFIGLLLMSYKAATLSAQRADSLVRARGDSVTIRMVDVDVRAALQVLGSYVDRPLSFASLPPVRITLTTPQPIARAQVVPLLKGLLETHNLELALDTVAQLYRVRARPVATPMSPQGQRAEGHAAGATAPAPSLASSNGLELFVIRLRHARAADVAAGVNALYGRASALGEIGANESGGTLNQQLRQSGITPQNGATAAPIPQGQPTSGGAALAGEVTIVPDARTNALLVRSSRTDFGLIEAAVKELDVRPLQVLIEVVIAEVRRDRGLTFGVETQVPTTALPERTGGRAGGTVAGGGGNEVVVRLLDLSVGTTQLNATLRAAASRGDVQIVSRPVVIAANNELAEILVGSQRPFVQVQRSLPTDAPSRDQVVQYRDVGTRLSVRPTISSDGYVMIAVTQEVNAATTETAFDAPVISTRSVQTQLLIKDKQSVVLGGLIDRQRDNNQSGVPILSSIPFIGGLFGRVNRRTTETELFVFLTPRIIADDAGADAVTAPLRERARIKDPGVSP